MFMQDEKKKMKPDIKKAYLLQKMQAGSPLPAVVYQFPGNAPGGGNPALHLLHHMPRLVGKVLFLAGSHMYFRPFCVSVSLKAGGL